MSAYRAKRIRSAGAPQFWVTEFSWDTKPPDPRGVPLALHARWTSEALYRMWRPASTSSRGGCSTTSRTPRAPSSPASTTARRRAKPALQAFRFPFVAFRQPGGRVLVWGRTPDSRARRVLVQQRVDSVWRLVGLVTANRYGIFTTTVQPSGGGPLRAVAQGVSTATGMSRPFSLVVPPDRYVRPFG